MVNVPNGGSFGDHRRYLGRQASREGFKLDDDILTEFERFEVVWPLDVADGITGPTSAST